MTVDTKTAPRRTLCFASFDEVLAEIDRIEAAMRAGTATTTGNWSIGQIGDHCARFIRFAIDGFEGRAPGPVRFFARLLLLKKAVGDEPISPGFQLPKKASSMLPTPGITDEEGLGELRKQIKRVLAGKAMTQDSPLLGPLTHEQWTRLQCKHCALHLGFIDPGNQADTDRTGGGACGGSCGCGKE